MTTLAGPMRLNVWALIALGSTAVIARADDVNEYPTVARSEYVFGCMKSNGENSAGDRSMLLLDRRHRVSAAV